MDAFIIGYTDFFRESWLFFGLVWIALIYLARTKVEMYWLDIYIPLFFVLVWPILELIRWLS